MGIDEYVCVIRSSLMVVDKLIESNVGRRKNQKIDVVHSY